jgi:hypothetical protein
MRTVRCTLAALALNWALPAGAAAPDCTPKLALAAATGAMIDLALMAPCNAGQRVVLHHAGLTVTYQTDATGALRLHLPALEDDARVTAILADIRADGSVRVPGAATLRRFVVQWLGPNGLSLRAEGGGSVMLLGDPDVPSPLLAEVFTLPAGAMALPAVEAAVTQASCGNPVVGEMLLAEDGRVKVADLWLSMPACDGAGGFVVIDDPGPALALALER